MMKKLLFTLTALLLFVVTAKAQYAEAGPTLGNENTTIPGGNSDEALFDLEFIIDVGANGSIGAQSQAGVIFFNDQYWVSTWNSDIISILDSNGDFVETVIIPGLTGTRGFSTDGTRLWIGNSTLQIFEIDPVAKEIINTIDITTSSDANARMAAYDPTLDSGNGGFWIGSFSSDIASVDMDGNELSVVPSADHGMNLYGGVVDTVSPDGPFLWVHHLPGAVGDPERDQIVQLSLPDALPTGVLYDFATDAPADTTEILGGGISISPAGEAADDVTIVALCQCTPSNLIFGIELIETLGNEDNSISNFTLYPNPSNGDSVTIKTQTPGSFNVAVFDVLGKQIINTVVSNNSLNVSSLNAGIYIVQIEKNGVTAQKKLIVR